MNRRHFFAALGAALAAPATPHRVYSFLWDNPLVVEPDFSWDLRRELVRGPIICGGDAFRIVNPLAFAKEVKAMLLAVDRKRAR